MQRAREPAVPLHPRLTEQRNLYQHTAHHKHANDGLWQQHARQQQDQPRCRHPVAQPVPHIEVDPHGRDDAPPLARAHGIALIQPDGMQPRYERERGRQRSHTQARSPGMHRVQTPAHPACELDDAGAVPNTCSHNARTWAASCAQVPAGTRAAGCPSSRNLCWRARKSR